MSLSDSSKSSNLNLYNKNDLSEKSFFLECDNEGTSIESTNKLEIITDNFKLSNTNPNYTFQHLGKYLYDNNIYVLSRLNTNNENILTNETRINTEIVDRIAQGSALNSLVTNEIQRATLSENEISNNLANEITNRTTAITNERNDRISSDNTNFTILNTLIQNEKNTRIDDVQNVNGRLDTLLEGTTVDLDQLSELVQAYQNADTSILHTLSSTIDRLTTLENRFNNVFVSTDP